MAPWRGPSSAARSASVVAMRAPVSNKMSVAGMRLSSLMRARRAPSFAGKNPSNKNRAVGRPLSVRAASTAEAPGNVVTRAPAAHELVTGVGDERRPGVRDQRDRGILGEPGDELRPRLGGIVLVIGGERGGDAKMVEKLAGDARVLACDEVGGGEHLERPHGDVAQIADRSGDQIEAARKRRRAGRVAVEDVGASGAVAERARGCGGGCGRPHAPYSSGARLPRHGRRKKSLSFSFG